MQNLTFHQKVQGLVKGWLSTDKAELDGPPTNIELVVVPRCLGFGAPCRAETEGRKEWEHHGETWRCS